MNRSWILLANAALVVLGCFLAARILATLAGHAVAPETAAVTPVEVSARAASRGWDDRRVILERNLFHASTLTAQAGAPTEAQESYEETQLPLELLGTVAARDQALARAAVLDTETRTHRVVHVGDLVGESARVLRIERRRVVLENDGRREELSLAEDPAAQPSQSARRPARRSNAVARARPGRVDVERLARNRFALPRDDVESVAANPAALFSQARILPKYEDGQMVGVQLNAIKPDSLFSEIGIQDGDVIHQINGIEVKGQQESAAVLRELTQASQFNVTVTGADGQTRELQYEVR